MDDTPHPGQERLHYIDWLRVLLIAVVFLVHSAMPFNSASQWHIANAETSFAVTACIGFCYQWTMPLFFTIAGAGACLSLRSRSPGRFLKERCMRLLMPFLAGMAFIAPAQGYVEWLHKRQADGSFVEFYPEFLSNAWASMASDALLETAHLWFLEFLFVYSVIALPVFLWLGSERGRRLIETAASLFDRKGVIFLCIVPLAIVQASLRVRFHEHTDWADFLFWLTFFVYGFFLAADRRFERAIVRHGPVSLGIGIACFVVSGFLFQAGHVEQWEYSPSYTAGYFLYEILRSVNIWSWVVFFLYLGIRFLKSGPSWLRHANEGVLPFYILHHPLIIVFGFYVVQWDAAMFPKYLLLSLPSFATSVALYVFVIKRVGVLRLLFGMRPKR